MSIQRGESTGRHGYDVIVIGGGHAACEAALAAARIGAETLLLTANLDTIAYMPCNPSIGGPAKGHLVREIDALGGAMAEVTDRTAIQIRTLNSSKGPAVQATRAQCDKRLYAMVMKEVLEEQPRLTLRQETVIDLPLDLAGGEPRVREVVTQAGNRYRCRAAILTTGTFLRARMVAGATVAPGGRAGEGPANELSAALGALGFRLRRLKTGTPPRIDARSVDFSRTTPQPGSPTPLWFSHAGAHGEIQPILRRPLPVYPQAAAIAWRPQMACYLVHTNEEAHGHIRANIGRAPMYDGTIEGVGPRYCPSIEDKVVRFPQKAAHQLFLEPEGWRTAEIYVQGANTSLPHDVQWALLRAIPALREATITRFGYAVEYDAVDVGELTPTLEAKRVRGLFCAGQVNGTSGYEEAAGQGLIAGINAARHAAGAAPVILRRDQAYLGVMIDDLVTQEFVEPYRMLTSRAEYRLLLRGDNADLRLTPLAHDLGLVSRARYERARAKECRRDDLLAALAATRLTDNGATQAALAGAGLAPIGGALSALDLLRRPHTTWSQVAAFLRDHVPPTAPLATWAVPDEVAEQAAIEAQYAHYIATQQAQVKRLATMEGRAIPRDFAYAALPSLRAEAREKLLAIRPATLGQAGRIAGVTPSDLAGLLVALERGDAERGTRNAELTPEEGEAMRPPPNSAFRVPRSAFDGGVMRILLITDIHANLVALEAVIRDAGTVDAVWCLGDVVGYGPRPNECCAWVEAHAAITVVGNHDWAALGRLDLDDFNEGARQSTLWTVEQLTPHSYQWLDALPNRYIEDDTTLVHGSPRHPVWEYLLRPAQAAANFEYFDTDVCFVGHTHAPAIFHEALARRGEPSYVPTYGEPIVLSGGRYIVNPGSVGQPRDGDPRAAYALYDPETRTIEFRRLAYDLEQTQRQMRDAGLPESLIARLARGL